MTLRRDEIFLGAAVFWVLALLVVPLPAIALDLMLSLSLTVSLLILLVALYTDRPLDFSVFPPLLLIVTLMRLGLNVASTRLILVHGAEGGDAAGNVIEAFANIAIGGNYLVGIILFLIFVTINFVVISKGSGRIAEVAARFTLDSMPGKQMAIDADLNQGVISDDEARKRRSDIQREADFYGAMDGASKFVKGDAIAGLLIVGVNILGGLAIGVLQAGLPVGEAVETYTTLTVGDGLVGQVPALIVSTAAGLVVSRAAGGDPLTDELKAQVFLQPRALFSTSILLGGLAIAPGTPFAPFALLAAGCAAMARWSSSEPSAATDDEAPMAPEGQEPEADGLAELTLDEIELQVGYGLVPLVDVERSGELPGRIRAVRRQLASELGFLVPLVHIRDNLELEPHEYAVLIRGNRVSGGTAPAGRVLAIGPVAEGQEVPGIATTDPAFGLPAVWIQDSDRARAEAVGYTVVDSASAIATHISEILRNHATELLTRQRVSELLDAYAQHAPKVVDEIVPAVVSVSVLHRSLRVLLDEGVSIRDIGTVLETLAEFVPTIEDPDLLTDLVRERLARTVARPHVRDGSLHVLTLEPELEQQLSEGVQRTPGGSFLAVEPSVLDRMLSGLRAALDALPETGPARTPVLLSSQSIRSPLYRLLSRVIPRIAVLSHNELPSDLRVVAAGQVRLQDVHQAV
jgi:flagellar biosynthesis protein FlhA